MFFVSMCPKKKNFKRRTTAPKYILQLHNLQKYLEYQEQLHLKYHSDFLNYYQNYR